MGTKGIDPFGADAQKYENMYTIINYAGGSVGTLNSQQAYKEVKTLTITVLNLEFADFVVFWPFLVTNYYL